MATVLNYQQIPSNSSVAQMAQTSAGQLEAGRQRAQQSAAMFLEDAKQQADALGISVADFMKENESMYKGALSTLMGNNANRVNEAWSSLANQNRSAAQIINYEVNKWAMQEDATNKAAGVPLFDKIGDVTKTKTYQKMLEEGQTHEQGVEAVRQAATEGGWTPLANALGIKPESVDDSGIPTWPKEFKDLRNNWLSQVSRGSKTDWNELSSSERTKYQSEIRAAIHTNELPPVTDEDANKLGIVEVDKGQEDLRRAPADTTGDADRRLLMENPIEYMKKYNLTEMQLQQEMEKERARQQTLIDNEPMAVTEPMARAVRTGDERIDTATGEVTTQPVASQREEFKLGVGNLSRESGMQTVTEDYTTQGVTEYGRISRLRAGMEKSIAQSGGIVTKAEEQALEARAKEAQISYQNALTRQLNTQITALEQGNPGKLTDAQKELADTLGAEYDAYLDQMKGIMSRTKEMKPEEIESWNAYIDDLSVRYGVPTYEVKPESGMLWWAKSPIKMISGSIGLGQMVGGGTAGSGQTSATAQDFLNAFK